LITSRPQPGGFELRDGRHGGRQLVGPVQLGEADCGQRKLRAVAVGQHLAVWREGGEVAQGFGRVGRGQQADPARHHAGGEADREVIAIATDIEHMLRVRQHGRDAFDVGQEAAQADRLAMAAGDDGIRIGVGDERQVGHGV